MARTAKTATTATKTAEKKETATTENSTELEALVKEQAEIIKALKEQLSAKTATTATNTTTDNAKVTLLWQAPVAEYNIVELGENGRIGRLMGKQTMITISKSDFSQIMTPQIRHFIDIRWLIVLCGLEDEERKALGIEYKENEYLSKDVFMNLIGFGEKIIEIYPQLCESHKKMVEQFYYEAWKSGREIKKEVVVALNKIQKSEVFKEIIEAINEKELEA